MGKYCMNCGAVLDDGTRFCDKCGTPVSARPVPQRMETPKMVSQQYPHPDLTRPVSARQQMVKTRVKKQTGNSFCIALSVLLVLEVLIIALFGWPGFAVGGESAKTTSFILEEGQTVVTDESGVSVDFGRYNGMDGEKIAINELGGEMDEVQGGYITTFDIGVEGREQFDSLLSITVPYDESKTIPRDEESSVLAQYLNPKTGEWELVDYIVNTDDNTVTIYTDHLSQYCTVTVNDPTTPYARIAKISNLNHMDTARAIAIIDEVQKSGQPGEQAQSLAMELLDTCFYYPNVVLGGETSDKIPLGVNLAGWIFDAAEPLGPMMKKAGDISTGCGVAFSAAQVCYAIYKNESDALIAAEGYKAGYQTAIAYYGNYAMKLSMLGVIAIDYSLNRFLDEANQTYKDDIYTIVKYYNEKESPRTDQEWYNMIMKLYQQHGDNPQKFQSTLEGLMYHFSARFFQLDYEAQSNTAGFAGKKLPYVTIDAQNYCVEQYVSRLGEQLQPVLKDAMKQIAYEANKEYRSNLNKLRTLLNQNIIIDVLEEIPEGEKSVYGNATVVLVQGDSKPNKDWMFKLDGKGCASFGSTILGYMQGGCPTTLKLWLPDRDPKKDKPDLTQSFVLRDKVTSVVLKDMGIDAKWFEGNWRHVDLDVMIRLGISDSVNCYYAAEIAGEEVVTYTTYEFNKETTSLKMNSSDNNNSGGKFWINETVWQGYEENGVDFIKTEKNLYQRVK